MRCLGPKRSNKYLAPDVKKVPITFLSDLMAQIELNCHISHLSLMYSLIRMEWYIVTDLHYKIMLQTLSPEFACA